MVLLQRGRESGMNKLAPAVLIGAFALAGCNVNVTSNDAATLNTINQVQAGAEDFFNQAGNIAGDAGNELGRAADAAGNSLDRIGDRAQNVDVDVNVDGNKAN
jgi:hypothetical protein